MPGLLLNARESDRGADRFGGRLKCDVDSKRIGIGSPATSRDACGDSGCRNRCHAMGSLQTVRDQCLDVAAVQHRHGDAHKRRALGDALRAHGCNRSGRSEGLEGHRGGFCRWGPSNLRSSGA